MSLSETGAQENERFREEVVRRLAAAGIEVQECRSCGDPILFLKTNAGKWQPLNMGLESHFGDCPEANKHRR